jgi:tetratricopeptide (TPR) repeat protein
MNTPPPDQHAALLPVRRWRRRLLGVLAATLAGLVLWLVTIELALWRGSACLEARQHQRALSWLRWAERLSWERAELHFLLARCERRLGALDQVSTHLLRAHELGWDTDQLEREDWLALAQTNQFEAVSAHWSALFEHPGSDGPEISKAYVKGALAWFRIPDARRVLSAWEADYPHDPDPPFMRGQLCETLLDWAGAAQSYRRVLELEPGRIEARFALATSLIKLGQLQEAESHLARVVQEDPENIEAKIVWAQSVGKLGNPDEAKRQLAELLNEHPQRVEVLLELGNLELGTNQPQEALEHLRQAAKRKPESREVAYAYAKALQANGRTAEAAKWFKFVDQATKPLMDLNKLIDQLMREPENLDVRFQIAAITWKYKSRDEGEKWFLSLLRINPQHAPTHAALAIHYAASGDSQRAAQHRQWSDGWEKIKKVEKIEAKPAPPLGPPAATPPPT